MQFKNTIKTLRTEKKLTQAQVAGLLGISLRSYNSYENAKKLSSGYKEANSNLQWGEMSGLRNRIVHDYGNINLDIIFDTLKNDIPDLLVQLDK